MASTLKRIYRKVRLLWHSLMGNVYCMAVSLGVLRIPSLKPSTCTAVVSLTSYGRRVSEKVAYYTLVSILRQDLQPSRIILWLSEEEWNADTLPRPLKSLMEKGVEVRFCKDIRSYKKLIPTLQLLPDADIITLDDDIIYSPDTVRCLVEAHQDHPADVICNVANHVLTRNGVPQDYGKWQKVEGTASSLSIFPVGFGGNYYPAGILGREVLNAELFTRLCPLADDIWFWFCALQRGVCKQHIVKQGHDLPFDALYQYFHAGSALTHSNRFEHQNDRQFRELFAHFHVQLAADGTLIHSEKK